MRYYYIVMDGAGREDVGFIKEEPDEIATPFF